MHNSKTKTSEINFDSLALLLYGLDLFWQIITERTDAILQKVFCEILNLTHFGLISNISEIMDL